MVYRFSNESMRDVHMGLPVFHTSVRVNDLEYEWGRVVSGKGNGRLLITPRSEMGSILHDVIDMGEINLEDNVDDYVLNMAKKIARSNNVYNLLTNNCNHFTDTLCRQLTGQAPGKNLNRAANWTTFLAS